MSTPELKPETPTPITEEGLKKLAHILMHETEPSPTPLTDAAVIEKNMPENVQMVWADFARKLESALNAAREALSLSGYCIKQLMQSLPTRRDWLDPDLENLFKAALAQIDKALSPQQSKTT